MMLKALGVFSHLIKRVIGHYNPHTGIFALDQIGKNPYSFNILSSPTRVTIT